MTLAELFLAGRAYETAHGVWPKRVTVNEDPLQWLGLPAGFPAIPVVDAAAANTVPLGGFERVEFDPEQAEPIVCHRE